MIKGKGMPISNDDPLGPLKKSYKRGDLIVNFDIEFPTQLTEEQRQELTSILDEDLDWSKFNFIIFNKMKSAFLFLLSTAVCFALECPDLTCAFNFFDGTCYVHSGDHPVTKIEFYSC